MQTVTSLGLSSISSHGEVGTNFALMSVKHLQASCSCPFSSSLLCSIAFAINSSFFCNISLLLERGISYCLDKYEGAFEAVTESHQISNWGVLIRMRFVFQFFRQTWIAFAKFHALGNEVHIPVNQKLFKYQVKILCDPVCFFAL